MAIETVDKCKISVRQQTYNTLIYLRQLLYDMNIRVVLVKIKGHSGITGNETADTEARQVACQMFKGNIIAPDERLLTVSDAYGISSEIARKSWQRLLDNESTGCYTYNCIPIIGTKVMFSKIRNIGIAYSRMLLHDTMLNKDSLYSDATLRVGGIKRKKKKKTKVKVTQ